MLSLKSSPAAIAILLVCATAFTAFEVRQPKAALAAGAGPAYTKDGDMLPPAHYREWVYLSSGIDMDYAPGARDGASRFDNVFVNPEAYRSFLETGTWPDKTVFALEVREARSKGSINQSGHFQGTNVMALEVHVKDQSRFHGGWAFFGFDTPQANGKQIPEAAVCYSCHQAHGAVDTTFVQFYPTLLPIAQKKNTLSAHFLKENADTTPAH